MQSSLGERTVLFALVGAANRAERWGWLINIRF